MNNKLLNATMVCSILNISKPTLYSRIKKGMIETVRHGRDYKFNANHIEDLMKGKKWELPKEQEVRIGIGKKR